MLRVGYQGEPGAFSEQAALELAGAAITLVPCPTFESVFAALAAGGCDRMVVPVENSLAGPVAAVAALRRGARLHCRGEVTLPIELHLLGLGGAARPTLAQLRSAASHPVALAQCRGFFTRHLWIAPQPADDTAGSVRLMVAAGDPSRAAIASRRAAGLYGADILREHLEDAATNCTRFLLLELS